MSDTYTISFGDIKKYLSTVPYGAPVGIPQHKYDCLIGKTLQQKYPGKLGHVGSHNHYVAIDDHDIEPPEEVQEIAEKFDDLWEHWDNEKGYGEPVTLATLRDRIPELFSPEGKGK